ANIREIFCLNEPLVQNIDFISELRVTTWGFGKHENSYWEHPYFPLKETSEDTPGLVYARLKKLNSFYLVFNTGDADSKMMFSRLRALLSKNKSEMQLIGRFTGNTESRQFELYRVTRRNDPIVKDIDAPSP
ncbi:MAG: hypothetical protein PHF11_07340, partial [Candidatus Omnitrophica bacterium]|nr:hypothetical protein [Candidatus Omnitrophota bacterium]